jgi:hypothetical protein
LLFNAYDNLSSKDIFEVSISELKNYLDFNSKNNEYLKQSIDTLLTTKVEFNILSKEQIDRKATTLLSECYFKK